MYSIIECRFIQFEGDTAMFFPDLSSYDLIVVNTSAGKDSQAMLDLVCTMAAAKGLLRRVVAVHCDLGDMEWKGVRELAETQANHYGIRFIVVKKKRVDLLERVEERGMWPSSTERWCTSDFKRAQVDRVITGLVAEVWKKGKQVRVLNCLGMRAEESPARRKMPEIDHDVRCSNGKRYVDKWLPIHDWALEKVWARIKASGVPHHFAYDIGMPRLSCVFCIFSPESALLLAGKHNPELLDKYCSIEEKIGHTFRHKFSLASVREKLLSGVEPGRVQDWVM